MRARVRILVCILTGDTPLHLVQQLVGLFGHLSERSSTVG
jgi:hypothetical protein